MCDSLDARQTFANVVFFSEKAGHLMN